MIIAIDGPAASGKGTLARKLAAHYGFRYLDTGALYRAIARDVLADSGDVTNPADGQRAANRLDLGSLSDPALRNRGVGEAASLVAKIPEVREALLECQRKFANTPPGAVLDGRDIGTVVCPDADLKLFVIASVEARAKRRFLELRAENDDITEAEVLANLHARDARDQSRGIAPLTMAEDAHLLDTTNLDIEAAFSAAVEMIDAAISRAGCAS